MKTTKPTTKGRASFLALSRLQLLSFSLLLAASSTCPTSAEQTLHIRRLAQVHGPDVLLQDIVQLPSHLPKQWGDRTVLHSPNSDDPQDYSLADIAYALQRYPDMSHVMLRGQWKVTVRRETTVLDRELIREKVRAFVRQQPQWSDQEVAIDFLPFHDNVSIPYGELDIQVHQVSEASSSHTYKFDVDIHVDQDRIRTVRLKAKIVTQQEVWVAGRNLVRGELLSEGDLKRLVLPSTQVKDTHPQEIEELIGKEINRNVKINQPVLNRFLRPPLCARRGDTIKVSSSRGPLHVSLNARALGKGRLGERIQCMNEHSQRRLLVRLTAPQEAVVDF